MASDYQIFLRDEQVVGLNAPSKRTIPDIQAIIESIIPTDIKIQRINPAGGGYFISHDNDLELNYIFKPEIINKLKDKHLKTDLAHRIHDLRKIVIPDIPDDIYARTEADLIAEINVKNSINTLTLTKFDSVDKNKKYFFITLDSIAARNLIIDSGKIKIFNTQFSAYKPISKPKNTPSGNLLPQQSNIPASAQNRGFALPSFSRWGGPHRQNQQPPINTSTPPPGYQTLRQGPLNTQRSLQPPTAKSSIQQGPSESDLLFNALVINQICKTISCGIENPETYLALQNKALSQRGLPPFEISTNELLESKNLYFTKQTTNPPLTQSPTSHPISAPNNTQSPTSPSTTSAPNNTQSPTSPTPTSDPNNTQSPTLPTLTSDPTNTPTQSPTSPPPTLTLTSNPQQLIPKPQSTLQPNNPPSSNKPESTDPSHSTIKPSNKPGIPSYQFNKFPHHLASIHQSSSHFVPHHIL